MKQKKRLPKLTRRGRVIRNLALAALVLALLPGLLDWPAWSSERVFRRLEREALLSPSEIVLRKGESFLTEGEDWITVGQVEQYDSTWKPLQRKRAVINHVLPKGELAVAGLPEVNDHVLTVAVHGMPERAAAGKLSVTISGLDPNWTQFRPEEEETFTDWAAREGDWLFFDLASHGDHPGLDRACMMDYLWHEVALGWGLEQYPYTLELMDEQGTSLGIYSGTLPPDLRFLRSGA